MPLIDIPVAWQVPWNMAFLWGFMFGITCTLAGIALAWWVLRDK